MLTAILYNLEKSVSMETDLLKVTCKHTGNIVAHLAGSIWKIAAVRSQKHIPLREFADLLQYMNLRPSDKRLQQIRESRELGL